MRQFLLFSILGILLTGPITQAATGKTCPLQKSAKGRIHCDLRNTAISPEAVFSKESTAITITTEPGPNSPPLSLIQVDENGAKLRYVGILTDNGVMGDFKADDGIFSRKFQISEKKRERLYFAIVPDTDGKGTPPAGFEAKKIELRIIQRPSFVEMVSQAWAKIRGEPHTLQK